LKAVLFNILIKGSFRIFYLKEQVKGPLYRINLEIRNRLLPNHLPLIKLIIIRGCSTITYVVGIIVALGVVWTVTEAYLVFKNINKEEWKEANGFAKKAHSLLTKLAQQWHQGLAKCLHWAEMLSIK
jgi:hypothetical protein